MAKYIITFPDNKIHMEIDEKDMSLKKIEKLIITLYRGLGGQMTKISGTKKLRPKHPHLWPTIEVDSEA